MKKWRGKTQITVKQLKTFLKDDFSKRLTKNRATNSYRRLQIYVADKFISETFTTQVNKLRKDHSIPINGYIYRPNKKIEPRGRFVPPSNWSMKPAGQLLKIGEFVRKVCDSWHLPYSEWNDVILNYIFYSEIIIPEYLNSFNLAVVQDLSDSSWEDPESVKGLTHNKAYPVAIRLSPYISERDLIDYIEQIYRTEIEPLQLKYKIDGVNMGSLRKRNLSIQKRDSYIWFLSVKEDLSPKNISIRINRLNIFSDFPDAGAVSRIIAKEKIRRQ